MAANLTPQYLKAQEQYRRAATPDEELRWLEVMFRELPKHKASEKMQMDLKTKISKLKKEVEVFKKTPPKVQGVNIPRQGAGVVLILGGPNGGKSSLLAAVTRAKPEIADYPFTTRTPAPGMMTWEDLSIQVIDTPPVTADMLPPYLLGMIRGADLVLLMLDLGGDDGVEELQAVLDRLNETKTRLDRETRLDEDDVGLSFTQTILVANKSDAPGAAERLELFHELCPVDLPELSISTTTGAGLDELRADHA
ncbi:MAG: 50S ribosome-binding GTPase [Pirellulales bacterium]